MKTYFSLLIIAVIIFLAACQVPTEACFTYSPDIIDTTSVVTFNAACSQNASYFTWNFGDNTNDTSVTSATITHTFPSSGTYTVSLNAERKDGVSLGKNRPTTTQVITVQ